MAHFVIGVILLLFGIFYNLARNNNRNTNLDLAQISNDPRDAIPYTKRYKYLKDVAEYERDQKAWDEYNEKRKYWAQVIEDEKKKYGIKSEWIKAGGLTGEWVACSNTAPIYIDERLKPLFRKMEEEGVSLVYRPGVDYLNSCDALLSDVPQDCYEWLSKKDGRRYGDFDCNPSNSPLYLTPKMFKYLHMDYKKYYKDEYLNPNLQYGKGFN